MSNFCSIEPSSMEQDQTGIPEGFLPLFRTSPSLDTLGPLFYRPIGPGFIIGRRVAEKHGNARGTAHGGFLVTLADIALGYTAAASGDPLLKLTTITYPPTLPVTRVSAIGSKLRSTSRKSVGPLRSPTHS